MHESSSSYDVRPRANGNRQCMHASSSANACMNPPPHMKLDQGHMGTVPPPSMRSENEGIRRVGSGIVDGRVLRGERVMEYVERGEYAERGECVLVERGEYSVMRQNIRGKQDYGVCRVRRRAG